ncbi:YihY/virulence factor BrkB family protein [Armatimonas rosea]|uniref:YihY family inner membrane protein n=1 Tax=Armatimonas rosea TaxID=685828 RepID=A0A7W9SRS0_ARMRO|nr:YihY/virulence factor BrkB family protein [Armatimonas rosea]MBB6050789.1 YihY family inner membrane protein [Armatimonas rosea]
MTATIRRALGIFSRIDGAQAAAAFTYYAFFSLFPLIVLFVTVAAAFIDREQAGAAVLGYLRDYIPITGELQRSLFATLTGVIEARGQASLWATALLIWGALQFFTTLVTATNRAWEAPAYPLWKLLLKSLLFLGGMVAAVLLGVAVPVLTQVGRGLLPGTAVFLSLGLFYRHAPNHRVALAPAWLAALSATVLLVLLNRFFMLYLDNVVRLNVVYGAIGTVMALLLWIYFAGTVLLVGACLSAAGQAPEEASTPG